MRYDLSRATDRALRHLDVFSATGCSPEAFSHALLTGRTADESRDAVRLFLEEGEEHAFVDVVSEGAATFATLSALARDLLPSDHPTRAFLDIPDEHD